MGTLQRALLLSTGISPHLEALVMRGGRLGVAEMPAHVGVLVHSEQGVVLFDTGFAPRLRRAVRPFPDLLYPVLVPWRDGRSAVSQLPDYGICAREVRHVFVSHLHPDHVAGLRDFPNATFHLSPEAWLALRDARGLARVVAAWMPQLLPEDFGARVRWIDRFTGPALGAFPATCDLFGDGTLRAVPLPGHAPGQLGLLADGGDKGRLLFAADAAWLSRAVRERRSPSRLSDRLTWSPAARDLTLERLNKLWWEDADTRILLTHCPEHRVGELW
ncbi:MAG: MBL fold metallo-hydrolase [Deltaproteobacteria bacterium]|nr:MBL fold metallo-hydrolase [Deltaproteobacteria bacterium]